MIQAGEFLEPALRRGFDFWTGVPCSFLTPFINFVISDDRLDYVGAASEGEAVGIAAGAYLAGRKTVVMCQNSGLGNAVNPLTSLSYTFKIPTLFITTHRGEPGVKDEPQHELMGQITGALLDTMRIPWVSFPDRAEDIDAILTEAESVMGRSGRPFALVMKKGTTAPFPLNRPAPKAVPPLQTPIGQFARPADRRMTRLTAIRVVREALAGDSALIGTTGKIGRELYSLGHRKNQFYLVGSMGCASGLALGVHLGGRGARAVTVLDGDGAALMKMGTLATIGYAEPRRLLHVLIDNEAHESTGGQRTVSSAIDFALIASGCGYRNLWRLDDEEELARVVRQAAVLDGPSLVHVKVSIASDEDLGRPGLSPADVKEQFMRWFKE